MDLLDELKVFERIARNGSLSQAARELDLAPAGVSKRLAALEARLDVRLFHRSTRGLSLTDEGAAALERARGMLQDAEDLEGMFRERAGRVSGLLRIGAPSRFGARYVVPTVAEFLAQHPEADAVLDLTDRIQDLVVDGLDLAVRIGPLPDSNLITRKLADNHRIACAAPAYLERRGHPRRPQDLAEHDCLVVENNNVWRFNGGLAPVEVRVRPRVRCRHTDEVAALCRMGTGIALKSIWDVHDDIAAGRLVRVLPEYPVAGTAAIALLLPERQLVPPRVRAFIACLQARIGSPPYWERTGC